MPMSCFRLTTIRCRNGVYSRFDKRGRQPQKSLVARRGVSAKSDILPAHSVIARLSLASFLRRLDSVADGLGSGRGATSLGLIAGLSQSESEETRRFPPKRKPFNFCRRHVGQVYNLSKSQGRMPAFPGFLPLPRHVENLPHTEN